MTSSEVKQEKQNTRRRRRSVHGSGGFTLIATALLSTVMFGMVGLAVDAGRLIIHRAEVQNFVDAAATAAAAKLDGTRNGVELANQLATQGPAASTTPNRWNFNSAVMPGTSATYATSFTGDL